MWKMFFIMCADRKRLPGICNLISNSYRMSARGAWIGTTSARGNVNSKRRQPRGVYIPRAEVIPIHAPRARIR